jgi:hypothetical protein
MPSFKATVVGPQGAKVRRVQVEVKPLIKQLAARTPSQPRKRKTTNPPRTVLAPAPQPARAATPSTPPAPPTRPSAPSLAAQPVRPGKPEARKPRKGGMPMKRKSRT